MGKIRLTAGLAVINPNERQRDVDLSSSAILHHQNTHLDSAELSYVNDSSTLYKMKYNKLRVSRRNYNYTDTAICLNLDTAPYPASDMSFITCDQLIRRFNENGVRNASYDLPNKHTVL